MFYAQLSVLRKPWTTKENITVRVLLKSLKFSLYYLWISGQNLSLHTHRHTICKKNPFWCVWNCLCVWEETNHWNHWKQHVYRHKDNKEIFSYFQFSVSVTYYLILCFSNHCPNKLGKLGIIFHKTGNVYCESRVYSECIVYNCRKF